MKNFHPPSAPLFFSCSFREYRHRQKKVAKSFDVEDFEDRKGGTMIFEVYPDAQLIVPVESRVALAVQTGSKWTSLPLSQVRSVVEYHKNFFQH